MDYISRLFLGVQPVFDFMTMLWGGFPAEIRLTFSLFFGFGIAFVVIRNFIM